MVIIEKSRIIYYPYNSRKRYLNLTKRKGGIFREMNDEVEIAENVTFGDFFTFLVKEKELVNIIFASSLYGVPFELLIKDFKRKDTFKDKEEVEDIDYLEITWDVSFEDNNLIISNDFLGVGLKNNDSSDDINSYSIDFTPINKLKDYKLKLNEDFEIRDFNKNDKGKLILKSKKKFTLYDIIRAIFYELTWHGTPEMRDDEIESINYEAKNGKFIRADSVIDLLEKLLK